MCQAGDLAVHTQAGAVTMGMLIRRKVASGRPRRTESSLTFNTRRYVGSSSHLHCLRNPRKGNFESTISLWLLSCHTWSQPFPGPPFLPVSSGCFCKSLVRIFQFSWPSVSYWGWWLSNLAVYLVWGPEVVRIAFTYSSALWVKFDRFW